MGSGAPIALLQFFQNSNAKKPVTFVTGFSCAEVQNRSLAISYSYMGMSNISHTTIGSTALLKTKNAKKPVTFVTGFSCAEAQIRSLAMSYSHMGTPTLPSAQLRFTSEFGMGSGGATALWSLNKKGTI